jgi:hypothetical protein
LLISGDTLLNIAWSAAADAPTNPHTTTTNATHDSFFILSPPKTRY